MPREPLRHLQAGRGGRRLAQAAVAQQPTSVTGFAARTSMDVWSFFKSPTSQPSACLGETSQKKKREARLCPNPFLATDVWTKCSDSNCLAQACIWQQRCTDTLQLGHGSFSSKPVPANHSLCDLAHDEGSLLGITWDFRTKRWCMIIGSIEADTFFPTITEIGRQRPF